MSKNMKIVLIVAGILAFISVPVSAVCFLTGYFFS